MKRFLSLMLLMAVTACVSMAQVTVFDSGDGSKPYNRIPAIVKDKNGRLVAFADYRYGSGDIGNGHIALRMSSSEDNGKTWTTPKTVVDYDKTSSSGFNYAHGDAAVVCDRETGRMLMMCASGSVGYTSSTRNTPIRVGRYYSDDNGETWTGEDVTDDIYNNVVPEKVVRLFFSSGKICQSSMIKVGKYYRIYAALCTQISDNTSHSIVVYSDDFGKTWKALGSTSARPAKYGDEAKVEELPDGNVLLSCRVNSGTGRYFNIFTYTDKNNATGTWGTAVRSGQYSFLSGQTYAASCNGEIMIVPAKYNGEDVYVALQSAAMNSDRKNVGIYWKVLKSSEDYDEPSDFRTGWTAYKVSTTTSCYSTMVLDKDGNVAFLYEENAKGNSGDNAYDIQFKSLTLEELTGDYSYSEHEDPWVGKVLTIKRVTYDANGNIDKQRYMFNQNLQLGTDELANDGTPSYNHYWVVSKDPGSSEYYLSSLNGDGYMGKAKGKNYVTGKEGDNVPSCTDDYQKEFEIQGFVKKLNSSEGIQGVDMSGYALQFVDKSDNNKSKVMAVANDNGEINWFNHTAKREATEASSNRYWSTDFELKEVEYTNTIGDYGTFDKPTYFGFPVKFARSDDGKAVYQGEDYNFYATLKLPFAVTLPDDVKAYKCTSLSDVEGTQVGLEELELKDNVLPRETPVLLSMPGKEGDVKKNKTIYLRPALAQTMQKTGFAGTLGKKTFSDTEYNPETNPNIYILSKKNGHVAFYWLNDRTMAANKAYYVFDGTATNQSLVFNFGGTTAIGKVTVSDAVKDNEPVYDLCGRRVAVPVKGIYIRGNRKVVVR